jgi:hypothetical protein
VSTPRLVTVGAGRLPAGLYPAGGVQCRNPGYTLGVPSDLGSGILFVALFLAGLGGLLSLLAWLEPPHDAGPVPHPVSAGPSAESAFAVSNPMAHYVGSFGAEAP